MQQRRVLAIEGKISGSKPRDHFLFGWALWPLVSFRGVRVRSPRTTSELPGIWTRRCELTNYEKLQTSAKIDKNETLFPPLIESLKAGQHPTIRDNPKYDTASEHKEGSLT